MHDGEIRYNRMRNNIAWCGRKPRSRRGCEQQGSRYRIDVRALKRLQQRLERRPEVRIEGAFGQVRKLPTKNYGTLSRALEKLQQMLFLDQWMMQAVIRECFMLSPRAMGSGIPSRRLVLLHAKHHSNRNRTREYITSKVLIDPNAASSSFLGCRN